MEIDIRLMVIEKLINCKSPKTTSFLFVKLCACFVILCGKKRLIKIEKLTN